MRLLLIIAVPLMLASCASSYKPTTMPYWKAPGSDRTPSSVDKKHQKKKRYTHPATTERYPFRY